MELLHSGSPSPKLSECKSPLEKFSPQDFWDQEGILLIDYLPKGQIINAVLVQLKDILKEIAVGNSPKLYFFCTRLAWHL